MSLRFEWSTRKATANLLKHRVSFEEAVSVFADPLARVFDDEDHSLEEEREIIHRTFVAKPDASRALYVARRVS